MKLATSQDRYIKREDRNQNLMILALLVIAAAFGFLTAIVDRTIFVVILACMPLSLIALFWVTRHISVIPVVLLFTAIFLPFALPTGTMTQIADGMVLAIVLGAAWLFQKIFIDRQSIEMNTPSRWLLGFMIVPFLSLIWSNLLRDPLLITQSNFLFVQGATAAAMVLLPLVFLITANSINSQTVLKALVALMLIGGVPGLLSENGVFPWPIATRGLFTLWVVALAIGQVLFNRKILWPIIIALTGLAAAWIQFRFIQHTTWVSGWVPAFVALGVMAFFKSKKLLLGLAVAGVFMTILNFQYFVATAQIKRDVSGVTRLSAWQTSLGLAAQHPLLGTGPGGYMSYYRTYNLGDGTLNATHNNYLDMIAELGLVGFIPFIGFFTAITIYGYRLCRRVKGRGDFLEGATIGIFSGTVACLVAMAMGDWLIPFPYTQGIGSFDYEVYSWIFMGALIAIDRLTRSERSPRMETKHHTTESLMNDR